MTEYHACWLPASCLYIASKLHTIRKHECSIQTLRKVPVIRRLTPLHGDSQRDRQRHKAFHSLDQ